MAESRIPIDFDFVPTSWNDIRNGSSSRIRPDIVTCDNVSACSSMPDRSPRMAPSSGCNSATRSPNSLGHVHETLSTEDIRMKSLFLSESEWNRLDEKMDMESDLPEDPEQGETALKDLWRTIRANQQRRSNPGAANGVMRIERSIRQRKSKQERSMGKNKRSREESPAPGGSSKKHKTCTSNSKISKRKLAEIGESSRRKRGIESSLTIPATIPESIVSEPPSTVPGLPSTVPELPSTPALDPITPHPHVRQPPYPLIHPPLVYETDGDVIMGSPGKEREWDNHEDGMISNFQDGRSTGLFGVTEVDGSNSLIPAAQPPPQKKSYKRDYFSFERT